MAQFRRIYSYFVADEEIDRGSFSTVRPAYHNVTLQPCALKVISKMKLKKLGDDMNKSIEFSETVIAPLLNHRNIVKIIEVVETKKAIFQFMELCTDGNLLDICGDLSYTQKISILGHIVMALEYLHKNFICHRDIKLDNILLHRGIAKLCDFGFAAICVPDKKISGKCGSTEYVAPEIIKEKEYDGLMADMWSLGVLIYKLFSNEVERETKFIDYQKVTPEILSIVQKLLVRDPKARLTISQLRKELNQTFLLSSTNNEADNNIIQLFPNYSKTIKRKTSFNESVISRLCEIFEKKQSEIIKELTTEQENNINSTKILARLIDEAINISNPQVDASSSSKNDARKVQPKAKYMITSERSNSVPQMKEFDLEELNRRDGLVQLCEREFRDKSLTQIFNALRNILFKHNFCVSTNPTGSKTVVILNTVQGDVKLEMDCIAGEDDNSCRMTLSAPTQFAETAKIVFDEIQSFTE